jgi:hypothetical protein
MPVIAKQVNANAMSLFIVSLRKGSFARANLAPGWGEIHDLFRDAGAEFRS